MNAPENLLTHLYGAFFLRLAWRLAFLTSVTALRLSRSAARIDTFAPYSYMAHSLLLSSRIGCMT